MNKQTLEGIETFKKALERLNFKCFEEIDGNFRSTRKYKIMDEEGLYKIN